MSIDADAGDPWRFPYAHDLIAARAPLSALKKRKITPSPCESCGRPGPTWVVLSYDLPGGWCAAWIVCDGCYPPGEVVTWHAHNGQAPGAWERCTDRSCEPERVRSGPHDHPTDSRSPGVDTQPP